MHHKKYFSGDTNTGLMVWYWDPRFEIGNKRPNTGLLVWWIQDYKSLVSRPPFVNRPFNDLTCLNHLNSPCNARISHKCSHMQDLDTPCTSKDSYELQTWWNHLENILKYPATRFNPSWTSVNETPCEVNKITSPRLSHFTSNISKQTLRDWKDWRVSMYVCNGRNGQDL